MSHTIKDCALHLEDLGAKSSLVSVDSSSATTTDDHDDIAWAKGLKRSGLYFDGFVDDIESVLEKHRRDIVTFYGIYSNVRLLEGLLRRRTLLLALIMDRYHHYPICIIC